MPDINEPLNVEVKLSASQPDERLELAKRALEQIRVGLRDYVLNEGIALLSTEEVHSIARETLRQIRSFVDDTTAVSHDVASSLPEPDDQLPVINYRLYEQTDKAMRALAAAVDDESLAVDTDKIDEAMEILDRLRAEFNGYPL